MRTFQHKLCQCNIINELPSISFVTYDVLQSILDNISLVTYDVLQSILECISCDVKAYRGDRAKLSGTFTEVKTFQPWLVRGWVTTREVRTLWTWVRSPVWTWTDLRLTIYIAVIMLTHVFNSLPCYCRSAPTVSSFKNLFIFLFSNVYSRN